MSSCCLSPNSHAVGQQDYMSPWSLFSICLPWCWLELNNIHLLVVLLSSTMYVSLVVFTYNLFHHVRESSCFYLQSVPPCTWVSIKTAMSLALFHHDHPSLLIQPAAFGCWAAGCTIKLMKADWVSAFNLPVKSLLASCCLPKETSVFSCLMEMDQAIKP